MIELRDALTHRVATADGWLLGMRRYGGGGERTPVILCPGYGCSGLFLDYDDRRSLARYLAARGFDAWVLDLRGRGASRPTDAARARRWEWTFDDFVRYDLPAAIDHVRAETRCERVSWVGHSMGGAALYAFAGSSSAGRDVIAAAVTIASPVLFPSAAGRLFRRLGRLFLQLPLPASVPQREMVSMLWAAIGITGLVRIGMNPANIDLRLARQALRRAIHNVSLAKLRQLADWSSDQVFRSVDGSVDYRQGLPRIDLPLLVIAGADDRMAAPWSVHLAIEETGSRDKTFFEAGESTGCLADYGHIDLILGHRAAEEIFPRVGDWLAARTSVA